MKAKIITRNIWIISLVSLFTDIASEMLYPIMPIYLKSIGFSFLLIGILEGCAEATAGLSKGYFGSLSDHFGKRLPFVQIGYSLSAISKPMMALFSFPIWVFFARTLDRLGKGIRTGARDALLSDETEPGTKAQVFGFHRSMDTLGATIGPIFALILLFYFPDNYKLIFLIAFLPGIAAITFTLLIREKKSEIEVEKKKPGFISFINYWKNSPVDYRRLTIALLVFALVNSSDVFLLLKIKDAGFDDRNVIAVYIFYNLIYATLSYPLGILADKIGMKKVLAFGLLLFSIVYFGMAFANHLYIILIMFFLYGVYAAATEGVAKAWMTNLVEKKDTATAIGAYTSFQSICTLLASSLTGLAWTILGAKAAFLITALPVFCIALYVLFLKTKRLSDQAY